MQPANSPLISLDRATFRRDGAELFADTSWDLMPGEQWAVVGGNGSGKTTFAEGIAGHLPLSRGRRHRAPGQRPVVLVGFEAQRQLVEGHSSFHQARWFAAALEGAETVAGALSRQQVEGVSPYQIFPDDAADRAYRRRLEETIELLRLGDLLPRRVVHLSNGETRKLLLARALLRDPLVLILDDPCAGLDAAYRDHFLRLADTLMANGHTLLLLTRDAADLPPGITHVMGLEAMRIGWEGPRQAMAEAGRLQPPASQPPPVLPELPPPPPTPATMVEVRQATVRYGDRCILDRVDWRVERGEAWALLGRNGAGKSTLLSLILADNPQAYANDVRLFGRRRGSGESIWEVKQWIGWVAPEMQAHYTREIPVEDVVCSGFFDTVGLHAQATAPQRRAAADWLARLDLGGRSGATFGSLSAGEQRLILIARALVKNPPLLVLDEPCQGLDPRHTAQVVSLIDHLARQPGRALIMVTHRAAEIPAAVTRVLRLENGRRV